MHSISDYQSIDTYKDSESDDDGLAVVVDGDDEDQDIESDTEHAAGVVDPEGDEDVRVVPANGGGCRSRLNTSI